MLDADTHITLSNHALIIKSFDRFVGCAIDTLYNTIEIVLKSEGTSIQTSNIKLPSPISAMLTVDINWYPRSSRRNNRRLSLGLNTLTMTIKCAMMYSRKKVEWLHLETRLDGQFDQPLCLWICCH